MNLRKKCMAMLLALLMLISALPFGGVMAEETAALALTDITAGTTVGRSVTELVKLGIINGYEDGTFRPDNTITRGEIAKIIITFMGQAEITSDVLPSGFQDVDSANHWAKKFIKVAADLKIVNGYPDGTFMADSPVKYTEIVKMLVCMLGYGKVAESKTQEGTPWYSGYMAVAAEEGILKNAAVNNVEDKASRGTVAILTYNCLSVEPALIDSNGNTVVSDKTALEEFLGKTKIAGVVTAVSQTGITTGNTGLEEDEITVKTKDGTKTYQLSEEVDTLKLIGRRITAFTEKGDDSEYDLISRIAVQGTESWTYTPDMGLHTLEEDFVSYYANSSSTLTSVPLDDLKVIYNGKYDSTFNLSEIESLADGSVEFICNDGDGAAEVAVVTSYATFVVNTVEKLKTPPRIYGKYGAGELIIPIDTKGYHFSLKNADGTGDAKSIIESLSEWKVISVMRSKESAQGEKVWNAVVSRKTAMGKITEKDDKTIKIGNTTYSIGRNFLSYEGAKPAMETGEMVTVYLDHTGKIAGATAATVEKEVNLAYIIDADRKDGVDGIARIRLFGVTGKTKEQLFTLSQNSRIDGVSYNDTGKAILAIKEAAAVANAGKGTMGVISTDYSQFIRYTLNDKKEIDMIDTVVPNKTPGEDDLVLSLAFPDSGNDNAQKKLKHDYSGRFLNDSNQLVVNATGSTKVLEVPKDVTKLEKYATKSYSSAFTVGERYQIEAYNMNTTNAAKYILSFVDTDAAAASINENSPFILAKNVSSALEDGEPIDKLTGYAFPGSTSTTSLASNETAMFTGKYYFGDIFRYAEADGKVVETQQLLKRGTTKPEIYNVKTGAEITAPITEIEPDVAVSAAKSKRIFRIDDMNRDDSYSVGRFVFGTVIGLEEDQIAITPTIRQDACGIQPDAYDIYTLSNTKVYVYDYSANREADKVIIDASIENIDAYKKLLESSSLDPNSASQVLLYHGGNRTVKAIIIFKY